MVHEVQFYSLENYVIGEIVLETREYSIARICISKINFEFTLVFLFCASCHYKTCDTVNIRVRIAFAISAIRGPPGRRQGGVIKMYE
jgi:hypothetical protein